MRIAIVLDRFDPARGGLEHWAWQWATWLLDHGHEVAVVASEACPDAQRDGLELHTLGFAGSRYAFAERVASYLESLQVDLVHDLGVGWRCDLLQPQFGTRLADDRQNLRSLSMDRRLAARFSWNRRHRLADIRRLERRQYALGAAHVVAVSAMTRDDLVREHGLAHDRLTIIHNGVDPARFAPATPAVREAARRRSGSGNALVLLFAGHNFRLKGLDTVLGAVARLRRPDVRLIVTGRGPIGRYARVADRLGITSLVEFAGFVPDLRDAFAAADAFVQPTFYDPCSLTVLEAAASGLPVLTSRFNGAAELFRDGQSARIVNDPGDAAETAAAIAAWLDPDVRARMAESAQAVAATATHERCFNRLFDLCSRTLRSRQAA